MKCGNEAREIKEIEDKVCFRSCAGSPGLCHAPSAGVESLQQQRGCRACGALGWPSRKREEDLDSQGPMDGGRKGNAATGEDRQWPHGTLWAAGAHPELG